MSVAERRAALVESAYRVIADHGVEGATTRRICAQAGMPLASFHYAFASRMDLLCAVMDTAVPSDGHRMLDAIMVANRTARPDAPSGPDALHAEMEKHLGSFGALLKADPGRMQATLSLSLYAHNHPELQTVSKQMYDRLYSVASAGLRMTAEHVGARWTVPVEELGPVVVSSVIAMVFTYLSTGDDDLVDRLVTAIVREMLSYADTHVAA